MIAWAIETFVATTILMLLVLAIRAPVRKAFGPNMAYALWLLPVLRLLLPPLPESWREQAAAPVAAASDAITIYVVEPMGAAPQAAAEGSFGWLMAVLLVWAAGAAIFLAYHLISHSRFCSRLLKRARIDRMVAEGRVRVIETDAAHGPLAFGIWRKYVAFPRDFSERYDEVERDLALAHELGHHVRGDLIANWVALVVLALHWFNPVAWRAFRAFRADQEMACDALVLAGRAQALRHAYGRAIVKSAHGGAVSAACHLHTINELKGRLRMLSKTRKFSPIRIAGGVVGMGALSLAALGLTASGTQAAEKFKDKVAAATGIDLSGQEVPAPPAPPEAQEAPAAPEAPVAPGAPKVEKRVVRVVTGEPGKDGKRTKRVIMVRTGDGSVQEIDMPDMPNMAEIEASIPDIKSENCKGGDDHQMTLVEPKGQNGKRQRIIICTNRIEAVSAMAVKNAKFGLRSALVGLRHARAEIETETDMSAADKAEALKGIDSAIAEIEKEAGGND
jgi:beta-lactamase regulating signal transducer with metallopeptidase domain